MTAKHGCIAFTRYTCFEFGNEFLTRFLTILNTIAPDRLIRDGNKFWTWPHWHIDVDTAHLVEAKWLTVRCFNVFKNTQPERPVWNTTGMMNNGWHQVKPTLEQGRHLVWHHPVDLPGDGGWMKPSVENQLAAAKPDSGTPEKQFTRQEIEKYIGRSCNAHCRVGQVESGRDRI